MSAARESPWVPVSARLPEDEPGDVLELGFGIAVTPSVLVGGPGLDGGGWRACLAHRERGQQSGRWSWSGAAMVDVRCWMPVPPFPEEGAGA